MHRSKISVQNITSTVKTSLLKQHCNQLREDTEALLSRSKKGSDHLSEDDLWFLRDFAYLQFVRTDMAARRQQLAFAEMEDRIREMGGKIELMPPPSSRELARTSIKNFLETRHLMYDLKVCILRNNTDVSLVTSDDPAVLLNRFYAQRFKRLGRGSGISNAGAMLILPITPQHALAVYDGGVYTAPTKQGAILEIESQRDADSLNDLQFIKCKNNVYFSDWSSAPTLSAQLESLRSYRRDSWHKLHLAILDSKEGSHSRYLVVEAGDQRLADNESIMHVESHLPQPPHWFSKIKIRQNPRYVDTKTGAGLRRRPDLDA